MLALPKALTLICNAFAYIVWVYHHVGKLYRTHDIAAILYISAGVHNNKDIGIEVNSSLIVHAFSFGGKVEYSLSYDKYFEHEDSSRVLFYRFFG